MMDDPFAIRFTNMIVDSYGEVGLGLGSEMSQLLALANLNGMDHFIKEKLHAEAYVRYMDDGRAIFKTKEEARNALSKISEELEKRGLKASKKKTRISPLSQPIKFLGWRFILLPNGAIVLKPAKGKIKRQRNKLKRMFAAGVPIKNIRLALECMLSSLMLGNTYHDRQLLIDYFKEESTDEKTRNQTHNSRGTARGNRGDACRFRGEENQGEEPIPSKH